LWLGEDGIGWEGELIGGERKRKRKRHEVVYCTIEAAH
jgi:hypothetical protein